MKDENGCHKICDFCTHYRDDSTLDGCVPYAGEGVCLQTGAWVDATGGAECKDFECICRNLG